MWYLNAHPTWWHFCVRLFEYQKRNFNSLNETTHDKEIQNSNENENSMFYFSQEIVRYMNMNIWQYLLIFIFQFECFFDWCWKIVNEKFEHLIDLKSSRSQQHDFYKLNEHHKFIAFVTHLYDVWKIWICLLDIACLMQKIATNMIGVAKKKKWKIKQIKWIFPIFFDIFSSF